MPGYILLKIFGQDAEMFVETLGKVGGGTEADYVGNLVHTVLLLAQQFGCFLQAYRADEIVRGHTKDLRSLAVESGARHVHHRGEFVYVKIDILNVALNHLNEHIHKPVVGLSEHEAVGVFLCGELGGF